MVLFKRRREFPLRISDVMVKDVVVVGENETVQRIAELMINNNIGSVLVTDSEGKLRGIVTERNLVYVVARGLDPSRLKAWEVMTENPIVARPDDLMIDVINKMRELNVRHMPVVDRDGRPIGMVSFRDIVDAAAMLLTILYRPR